MSLLNEFFSYETLTCTSTFAQGTSAQQSPSASPARSRIWTPLFFLLNFLSVIPSLIGFLYSAHRFYTTPRLVVSSLKWESSGVTYSRSTRLDWFVSGMWALACAYFTHSLARGLLKRWLVYYPLAPTIVRVLSLQAICWPLTLTTHRVLSFDQPVAAWFVCATTAAISNVIQSWVTSNIVERKDRRGQPSWKFVSSAITAVLGPGIRTDKYRKGERVLSWKRVLWGTALPFAVLGWATTNALLWQQFVARYKGGGGVDLGPPALNTSIRTFPSRSTTLPLLNPWSELRILVLVSSSWSEESRLNRETFRNTTVRLFPPTSAAISIDHRFILGTAPSPQTAAKSGPGIEEEAQAHGDLLLVPARDGADDSTRKGYEAWKWADGVDVDYVIKTDDDVLVRMDVIAHELIKVGRKREYWKGFAYWDMPVSQDIEPEYDLPTYPPYTDATLSILSQDLVSLVAPATAPRLMSRDEAQALGIWLFASGVRPLHDHRIQQAQVCENDMIAKRFPRSSNGHSRRVPGAKEMYSNILGGRKPCEGFQQRWCGVCYPSCRKRDFHWKDTGIVCDEVKGATLFLASSSKGTSSSPSSYDLAPLKLPAPVLVPGSSDDPWIVPGILSRHSSPYSNTDDWHLLHAITWTEPSAKFGERHYHALESIWVHEPRANVIFLSTTLDKDFFESYRDMGYRVEVVKVGQEELVEREWYLGKESEHWVKNWDRWKTGPHFDSHLSDYLRYLFLYKYGGNCVDLDVLWIRSPPNSNIEYLSSDQSTLASDDTWTLDEDETSLSTSAMRARRGWAIFKDVVETAFSARYRPDCADCVGSRALTIALQTRRQRIEAAGFSLLPRHTFQLRPWTSSHELVRALPPGQAHDELSRMNETWGINLYSKMTSHLTIQPNSIAAEAIEAFSLKIPRRIGPVSAGDPDELGQPTLGGGLELRYPRTYRYRSRQSLSREGESDFDFIGSLDGRFDGLDAIYVRSIASPGPFKVKIQVSTADGGRIAIGSSSSSMSGEEGGGGAKEVEFRLEAARLRDVNSLLASIRYLPPLERAVETDELSLLVAMGEETVRGKIVVNFV